MMKKMSMITASVAVLFGLWTLPAAAEQGRILMHGGEAPPTGSMASHPARSLHTPSKAMMGDGRIAVSIPATLQEHMLSSMREHLETINAILAKLNEGSFDAAAQLAERNLGMSAMQRHEAKRLGRYMPEGMRRAGLALHKAATRFALKAQEGDAAGAYRALGELTATCVACHASYRVR